MRLDRSNSGADPDFEVSGRWPAPEGAARLNLAQPRHGRPLA
jgi:hypothetical protein